jgi:hypothetical protein
MIEAGFIVIRSILIQFAPLTELRSFVVAVPTATQKYNFRPWPRVRMRSDADASAETV